MLAVRHTQEAREMDAREREMEARGMDASPTDAHNPAGQDQPETPRRRRVRAGLVAAGAAAALLVAGLGVASAQSDPSPTTTAPATAPAPEAKGWGPGFGHRGFPRRGLWFGLHSEVTTPAPGGGYQTIATQVGEVTAVSGSSLTVKSTDGFSRTYAVDDNTLVDAGNEGIGDVKEGDQVVVVALVSDGKASAVDVRDVTQLRRLRERWLPPRPQRPSPTTTAPSA